MAVETRTHLQFLLNGRDIRLDTVPATQTLLDFLRLDRKLTGSKEGCAEGDCGACSVLVGRLLDGELVYEVVNACIRFMGSLDGCHVVTIEHLAGRDGALHPVQQAMVDYHGSQCGFCTPGIVMSLYRLWMHNPNPDADAIEVALQGNLCRCTGYAPILRAAQAVSGDPNADPLVAERTEVTSRLEALRDGARVECGPDDARFIIPVDADDLAVVLKDNPEATIVAGSTDVGLWVTKFLRDIAPAVFIGNLTDLHFIKDEADAIVIGAGVTYAQAEPIIGEHFPQLLPLWKRLGGAQIRYMGTIGGNIANGSPIGDTPPALIALGAEITLRKAEGTRTVKLEDFFIAYGRQDRAKDEFVESIRIPKLGQDDFFAVYKISKRRDEDISSVCGAYKARLTGGTISDCVIAYGGMAATPKRAAKSEAALQGCSVSQEDAAEDAANALAEDYEPITDMRASADYRMLVAQNLLRRFVIEAGGQSIQISRGAA